MAQSGRSTQRGLVRFAKWHRCASRPEGVRHDRCGRVTLHPEGLAPRILNLESWASHILTRLRREVDLTADEGLTKLLEEAEHLFPRGRSSRNGDHHTPGILVPLRIQTRLGVLSFFSTLTVFGTPLDVSLSETALELLYPAHEATKAAISLNKAGS